MSEAEWLAETKLAFVFNALAPSGVCLNERKCRLYAAACCRRIWKHIPDEASCGVIEALERVADGVISEKKWEAVCESYERPTGDTQTEEYALSAVVTCVMDQVNRLVSVAAGYCSATVSCHLSPAGQRKKRNQEERVQCDLVRCIFGNPFRRRQSFRKKWRTETAVVLATGIYVERAFDRLPILADALEEAGCDHDDVLNHCRGSGPHARGCWVVDLVLGKK